MKFNRLKSLIAPNSLRIQLLSRSLLILALLLGLIGLLQYAFMQDVVYRNKAESLQSQIKSVPPQIWQQNGPSAGEAKRILPFFIPDATLVLIDAQGNLTILANGPANLTPPHLTSQEYEKVRQEKPKPDYGMVNGKPGKEPKPNYFLAADQGGNEQLVVLQPTHSGEILQMNTPTGPLKDLLLRQLFGFLSLSLLALGFGLLGFLPVLRKTLDPLSTMVKTAEQIDAGNLDKRFPTRQGQLEIDRLAESFNSMLERLEASFQAERETQEQMRRFVADASHELRTPLTSIHGFLEVLLRGAAQQPDQLNKALKSMHSESERLTALVHDLLQLAKLDRTPQLAGKEGHLDELVQTMEPQLRILAGDRNLNLDLEPIGPSFFDPDKIKQVLLNLFHNAVQHTDPKEGQIRIVLRAKDNGLQLSIQDNGPGIPESHLPRLFDRFFRSDPSRTRKHGGAGLGLAISKALVDIHGGTIGVESREGHGATFHVWLPR